VHINKYQTQNNVKQEVWRVRCLDMILLKRIW
jgi:hypothetical protein